LCGVGDVDGMAAAAIHILSDARRWERMSAAAAADARDRFSMKDVVQRYEDLYSATLATTH
jgi:glycosyltransferase involved in cell wall biosynthesis